MQKAWQCLRSQLGLVLPASGPRQWAATPATLPGLTTLRPCQIHWAAVYFSVALPGSIPMRGRLSPILSKPRVASARLDTAADLRL